ncbi:hypothetical protein COBT_003129 [Conglomerata obtusa]
MSTFYILNRYISNIIKLLREIYLKIAPHIGTIQYINILSHVDRLREYGRLFSSYNKKDQFVNVLKTDVIFESIHAFFVDFKNFTYDNLYITLTSIQSIQYSSDFRINLHNEDAVLNYYCAKCNNFNNDNYHLLVFYSFYDNRSVTTIDSDNIHNIYAFKNYCIKIYC